MYNLNIIIKKIKLKAEFTHNHTSEAHTHKIL